RVDAGVGRVGLGWGEVVGVDPDEGARAFLGGHDGNPPWSVAAKCAAAGRNDPVPAFPPSGQIDGRREFSESQLAVARGTFFLPPDFARALGEIETEGQTVLLLHPSAGLQVEWLRHVRQRLRLAVDYDLHPGR